MPPPLPPPDPAVCEVRRMPCTLMGARASTAGLPPPAAAAAATAADDDNGDLRLVATKRDMMYKCCDCVVVAQHREPTL